MILLLFFEDMVLQIPDKATVSTIIFHGVDAGNATTSGFANTFLGAEAGMNHSGPNGGNSTF